MAGGKVNYCSLTSVLGKDRHAPGNTQNRGKPLSTRQAAIDTDHETKEEKMDVGKQQV